jgi:hypothetical protein
VVQQLQAGRPEQRPGDGAVSPAADDDQLRSVRDAVQDGGRAVVGEQSLDGDVRILLAPRDELLLQAGAFGGILLRGGDVARDDPGQIERQQRQVGADHREAGTAGGGLLEGGAEHLFGVW